MSFKSVFIAVFLGTAMIVAALLVNARRPLGGARAADRGPGARHGQVRRVPPQRDLGGRPRVRDEPARGTGASTAWTATSRPRARQPWTTAGFTIAKTLTATNCTQCHATEYEQFAAQPARGAGVGVGERARGLHAGADRLRRALPQGGSTARRSRSARWRARRRSTSGCNAVPRRRQAQRGRLHRHLHPLPRPPRRVGRAGARCPTTCGQCHMGPDHSQLEIYDESKHGVLFNAQRGTLNLSADPKQLTTADMPVPTCATCHMSGLEGHEGHPRRRPSGSPTSSSRAVSDQAARTTSAGRPT